MTREVVKLVPNSAKAAAGVMETLKNITAIADAEGLTGIAIAAVDAKGYTHTAFEGGENIALLIGSVERVKYRLLNYQDGS